MICLGDYKEYGENFFDRALAAVSRKGEWRTAGRSVGKRIEETDYGKRAGRLSVQERLVRQTCVMAFSKELKNTRIR